MAELRLVSSSDASVSSALWQNLVSVDLRLKKTKQNKNCHQLQSKRVESGGGGVKCTPSLFKSVQLELQSDGDTQ